MKISNIKNSKRMSLIISLLFVSVLSFLTFAFADSDHNPRPKYVDRAGAKAIQDIRQIIFAINLLNYLELNPRQMEMILNKAKELKLAYDKFNSSCSDAVASELVVYQEIKKQVEQGKIFLTAETRKKYNRVKTYEYLLSNELQENIESAIKEVESNLEEFQLQTIDNYIPCVQPVFNENSIGQTAKSTIIYSLERLKSISAKEYDHKKDEIIKAEMEKIKSGLDPCERLYSDKKHAEAEIKQTAETIRKMRGISFQLKKKEIADDLLKNLTLEDRVSTRRNRILKFLLSDLIIPVLQQRISDSKKGG
jgi:hypothetical protein